MTMTNQERLAQRRYIALALSGKVRKIPKMLGTQRKSLPSTQAWA